MFEKIRGHQPIIKHLEKELTTQKIRHAYLFEGMDGIGKKTVAKAFAKALLCIGEGKKPCGKCRACIQIDHEHYPDIYEISPRKGESVIKIIQIRELIKTLSVKPYSGNWRVILIDDADKMTTEAQNSLLKSLEEPLSYNVFILLTSHPKDLLRTIQSRCQRYTFHPLKTFEVEAVLGENYPEASEAIKNIAKTCGGSPGIGGALLEDTEIETLKKHYLRELYSILKGDSIKIFSLAEILGKDKSKCEEILSTFIQWFYEIELLLNGIDLPQKKEKTEAHKAYEKLLSEEKNQRILKTLFEMMETLQYNVNLRLQWEKTLIKIMKIQMKGYN
ncbi:MAG: DNA polymerase III subunit delta' [Eubacteriaceae bacterium]